MADFLAMEAEMIGARKVIIGHQDNWMPPITPAAFDMAPVRAELENRAPQAQLIEMGYIAGTEL
jgi:hypothetical protein